MGPEPGLQFGLVPAGVDMCEYGEYVRAATSAFGGNCAHMLKGDNTWMLEATASSESHTYLPLSDVRKYMVTLTHSGVSGQTAVATWFPSLGKSGVAFGFNIADPAFVSYMFDTYVPYYLLPHGPNAKNNIPADPAHPTYVEIDAFSVNRNYFGVLDNYVSPTSWANTSVTWDLPYPQTESAWYQGWVAFFAYAKKNHPEIRLSPHTCGMSDWSVFHNLFADVPSLMKEPFQIGGPFNHGQLYNQIQNLYWFANVAAPVFNNEARVISWGTWVDNGDIHTALALYLMVRGPNTFFDALITSPQRGINPKVWLPTVNKLGTPAGSSAVQVLNTAAGRAIGDGYNLLMRTYPDGVAYLNMTGTTRNLTVPVGSTDWNGNPISSITLADGKGEVVLSSGVRVPQISLTPSRASFGSQNIGSTSAVQTLTLSNTGSAALSIRGIAVAGVNAVDFNETNSCGTSVAVGASCMISVTFTPTLDGARSASVSVTDNATGSPHSATLNGTGVTLTAPKIAIYHPTNGAVTSNHFTMGALVKNAPSAISNVKFYDNGKLLGTAMHNALGEYLLTWQTAPIGNHTLTAIAADVAGNKLISAGVNITVK